MVRHTGGKVGQAGKTLASQTATKIQKSKAGKILNKHKQISHK